MSLRIGVDAWPLAQRPTGIGRYVRELCLALAPQMADAEFVLYSPRPINPGIPGWCQHIDERAGALPGYLWLKWRVPRLCAQDRLDLFWATRTLTPGVPVPVLTTVYDLNYRIVPETMPWLNRWAHRRWFAADVARAAAVAAISQGTSRRLAEAIGRAADAVVLPAVAPGYRPQPRKAIDACLSRHGLRAGYLLGVGTLEPRKNLDVLVEAYAALRASGAITQELVLAGSKGWGHGAVRAALERHRALPIRRLGYVDDLDLPPLYAGADAFVFPSAYEGFGIPVLEARACGTRVVATDSPEIREAGGDAAIYVAPTVEGLATGIEHALRQPAPAADRSGLPSWERSAAELSRALRAVARRDAKATRAG